MKTIKDAVIELGGKWPAADCKYMHQFLSKDVWGCNSLGIEGFCTRLEFESEAKRLGYINGYRWGVEYPTNGKRPDLPDDVLIDIKTDTSNGDWMGWTDLDVTDTAWTSADNVYPATHFKVIDPRYKPVDQLVKEGIDLCGKIEEKLTEIDNNWRERGVWPHSGCECELWHGGEFRKNIEFLCVRGMDIVFWDLTCNKPDYQPMPHYYIKPIRTEREKVIEAANNILGLDCATTEALSALYSAGMLVLPSETSNTK